MKKIGWPDDINLHSPSLLREKHLPCRVSVKASFRQIPIIRSDFHTVDVDIFMLFQSRKKLIHVPDVFLKKTKVWTGIDDRILSSEKLTARDGLRLVCHTVIQSSHAPYIPFSVGYHALYLLHLLSLHVSGLSRVRSKSKDFYPPSHDPQLLSQRWCPVLATAR